MRHVNLVVLVIGYIALGLLSLLSIVGGAFPPFFLMLGDLVAGPLAYAVEGVSGRTVAIAGGGLLLAGLSYCVVANIQARRRERTVVLHHALGDVMVSLPAIEDFARVLKGRIEGLKDIKGRVIYSRRGLKVNARITVFADFHISEVSQNVQEAIRDYIRNTLNIEQEINPTVVVTKIVNREKGPLPGSKSSSGKNPNDLYLR